MSAEKRDIAALKADAFEAEQHGDVRGMARALIDLVRGLRELRIHEDATHQAEQASDAALPSEAYREWSRELFRRGCALFESGRLPEAELLFLASLDIAQTYQDLGAQGLALDGLVRVKEADGDRQEALPYLAELGRIADVLTDRQQVAATSFLVGDLSFQLGDAPAAAHWLRRAAQLAREEQMNDTEWGALWLLLELADAGEPIPDAPALRARFAELDAAVAQPG